MHYREEKPCQALAGHIECLWFASSNGAPSPSQPERVLPDGCIEWIFHLGAPFEYRTADDRWNLQPRSFVVGELTRFLLLRPTGGVATMGVRFRPGRAYRFFPVPLDDLTDLLAPASDIWGPEGARIEERVLEAASDITRKQIIEAFLLERTRSTSARPRLEAATAEILQTRGRVRIASLAQVTGWSARQLERQFQAGVGLAPKVLSRIIRFQRLLGLVGESALREWAGAATESGYADQPHMVREFRGFAGQAPTVQEITDIGHLARNFISPQRIERLLGKAAPA